MADPVEAEVVKYRDRVTGKMAEDCPGSTGLTGCCLSGWSLWEQHSPIINCFKGVCMNQVMFRCILLPGACSTCWLSDSLGEATRVSGMTRWGNLCNDGMVQPSFQVQKQQVT